MAHTTCSAIECRYNKNKLCKKTTINIDFSSELPLCSDYEAIGQHNWVCISVGLYDSLCECTICGEQNTESVDNLNSTSPSSGCKGYKS